MNEDDKFFTQFQEAPRPEFAAALYKRISKPMDTPKNRIPMRRMALTFTALFVFLIAAAFAYPPARAQALSLLRQIGVFIIDTQPPAVQQPTAVPPDPTAKPLTAQSAAEAGRLAGFTVMVPQNLPDGYVQQGLLGILPNAGGKIVSSTYANSTREAFILINQYHYNPGDSFVDNVSANETVQDVEVRNHKGLWITGRMMSSPIAGQPNTGSLRPTNWLRWEENGIVYSIMSDGLTFEEMLQLAQDLK